MKFIDAHIHVCKYINGIGSRGELIPIGNGMASYADGTTFRIIPEGLGDTGFSIETANKVLKENNIEKAVILQGNYLGFQNLYAYEATQKYPSIFKAACTYDPFSYNREKIAYHLFEELKFKIMKLECSNGSGFMANHSTFDIDSSIMYEIYEKARKYHLTLVFDIGRPNNNCYQVDKLVKIIKEYPDVTFVICHLLAHQVDQLDLLNTNLPKFKLPNVYFDLASVINNTKPEVFPYPTASLYLHRAIEILGSEHLMWGTDMPSGITKDTYKHNIEWILNDPTISNSDKENIFYNTAYNVYFKE
ncbi:MAG: amidohydrolase family protein [Anaeroplasmataceae bacterium]